VEYDAEEWLNLTSTFYAQWTEDSIHWVRYSEFRTPENVGVAAFLGWDTRGRYELSFETGPFETIGFSASYQYQASWLLNDSLSFSDNMRIPYMPAHRVGASVDLRWNTGSLLLSGRYESLRYADTGNLLELEPHFLLNVTLNQKLNEDLTLFVAARNILNASYTSFAEYPMPGISVSAGVRARFDAFQPEKKPETAPGGETEGEPRGAKTVPGGGAEP
jgi:vitamin B12 transporter